MTNSRILTEQKKNRLLSLYLESIASSKISAAEKAGRVELKIGNSLFVVNNQRNQSLSTRNVLVR